MSAKKSILFVPAWWPASFFKEQQELTEKEYTPYVLTGTCAQMSLKHAICFWNKKDNACTIDYTANTADVRLEWIRYKSRCRLKKQHARLVQYVGETIMNLMNGQKPTLIHMQSISEISTYVTDWAHQQGIKVILTEHQLHYRRFLHPFNNVMYDAYNKVDGLYSVSNFLYRNMILNGFAERTVRVIGNFVNDDYITETMLLQSRNGRIIYVAVHQKGIDILFEVAKKMKTEQIMIDVYGLSPETISNVDSRSLYEIAQDLCIDDVVTFKGMIPHEVLLNKYAEYSVLLSTSNSETFGLAVAESIMSGTPVVCTDSGGVSDFVNHTNGIVVGIRDVEQICTGILKVLEASYDKIAMSQAIRERYGRKVFTQILTEIYHQYEA